VHRSEDEETKLCSQRLCWVAFHLSSSVCKELAFSC